MPYFNVDAVIEIDEFYDALTRHERKTMWELLYDEFYESNESNESKPDNSLFSRIDWEPAEGEEYELDPSHRLGRVKNGEAFPFETVDYEEISFSELVKTFLTGEGDCFGVREDKFGYDKKLFQTLLLQAPITEMKFFHPKKAAPLLIKTHKYKYGLAPRVEEVEFEDDEDEFND